MIPALVFLLEAAGQAECVHHGGGRSGREQAATCRVS